MNENIETLNVNEPIKQPIVNEIDTSNDANDFSDDFFEAKEMDNILDDNWNSGVQIRYSQSRNIIMMFQKCRNGTSGTGRRFKWKTE